MVTFLTDLMKKGYPQDDIFAVLFESERERNRRRMQAITIETVGAHRLQKMRDLLTFEKLVTWRRMNGLDRTAADDNQWASRPLPLTPEQCVYTNYTCRAKVPAPIQDHLTNHPV